ncbi:hypothetical protein SEA_VROOMVROOM_24 [Arthrobacter phage VroomVroom]|uniref:Uncharacterized protein n=1 Tax=Arthrobacter phage VroomVroom TaxID=3049371 RepID=A0AA49IPX9_9CAUD|nr:hypothetical protein SEA_VROOMVROOM_24 [Arthrobacter phage VroomVroom]
MADVAGWAADREPWRRNWRSIRRILARSLSRRRTRIMTAAPRTTCVTARRSTTRRITVSVVMRPIIRAPGGISQIAKLHFDL